MQVELSGVSVAHGVSGLCLTTSALHYLDSQLYAYAFKDTTRYKDSYLICELLQSLNVFCQTYIRNIFI